MRQLRADQLLSLGSLVTEMSERELHDISSTNPAVLAHLGTLTDWSLKKVRLQSWRPADERQSARLRFLSQMRAVISGVLRKRKLKVEQLTAVDLATFGHLICGLFPSEIRRLSAHNLRSDTQLRLPHFLIVSLCFQGFCCCSAQLQDFNLAEGLGFSFFPLKRQHGGALPAGNLAALHRTPDGGTHKLFVQTRGLWSSQHLGTRSFH